MSVLNIKVLKQKFTVCKVLDVSLIHFADEFLFIGKTDEELSLVCTTEHAPADTLEREDGWRGFRIEGVLDFSLIGILSQISGLLAGNNIGIFAVSTYNTDYILTKEENFDRALTVLRDSGYHLAD